MEPAGAQEGYVRDGVEVALEVHGDPIIAHGVRDRARVKTLRVEEGRQSIETGRDGHGQRDRRRPAEVGDEAQIIDETLKMAIACKRDDVVEIELRERADRAEDVRVERSRRSVA